MVGGNATGMATGPFRKSSSREERLRAFQRISRGAFRSRSRRFMKFSLLARQSCYNGNMDTQYSQATVVGCGEDLLERMVAAVEKVRERLMRSAAALESAGLPYAVIGGNAVAAWVSKMDPGAVRNTVDVDLMVNRLTSRRETALTAAGFVHRELMGVHIFLDGPKGRPRDAVHLLFAGEKVRPEYTSPAPGLIADEQYDAFKLLELQPLSTMKLTSFRLKDRVHLLDMIEVGLIDKSWCQRVQPELAVRLQELLDNPDG